jgi:phosphoserine phosphatase
MASIFVATIFRQKNGPSSLPKDCLSNFQKTLDSFRPSARSFLKILDGGDSPTVAEVTVCWDVLVTLDELKSHAVIITFERENLAQVVIQEDTVFRRFKRLAVFDMDSTLIQQEVIDEIARKVGVEDKVSAITERAMNGELDFEASLRERCSLLKGVSSNVFEELKLVITLTPGASDLVKLLKRLGFKTAVLSGGFTPLATWIANELGLNYVHANNLVVSDDGLTLTGQLQGEIVDSQKKRELVQRIAKENDIPLAQVLAVGDGANDLPMMKVAGLGVAFNAKERVQKEAPVRLNRESLFDVAFLFGISKAEVSKILAD